jgi:putative flippase GtrA
MFRKVFSHSIVRYAFVGLLTYVVELAVLIGLHSGLHTQRTVATGASFWVGLFVSFALQKLVAFQDFQKEVKAISRQAVWYVVLVGFNYVLTLVIVSLFPDKDLVLSRTVALATVTCWNYVIYRVIFKSPAPPAA